MNRLRSKLAFIGSLMCASANFQPASASSHLELQIEALGIILESAEKLCTRIRTEGARTQLEIEGAADAELSTLLERIVGLGIEGSAKYQSDEYSGLLRDDVANIIIHTDQCRLSVFNRLAGVFLEAQTEPAISDDRIETALLPPQTEGQYRGEFLSVMAMSAAQDATGEWLTVSMLVENISDEHIYLALAWGSSAMDDTGTVYSLYNLSGIRDMSTRNPREIGSLTEFAAGSRHTVLAVFRGKKSESRARMVSFSANLWFRTADTEVRQLPLGISNIALLR